MDIKLLGPLTAHLEGADVLPSADKPRKIFAVLALNANHIVSVPVLIEEIWAENPPRSAGTTLQTYILQLRRKLTSALRHGMTAKDVLVTRHAGYMLVLPPGCRDIDTFDTLTRQARTAACGGDHAAAYRLFTQALALRRGPALVDVSVGRALEPEIVRINEACMSAVEGRIEAGIRLGLHGELVSELAMLTARNPMNENLHAQLIVSLHRCGRISDALDAYRRLRTTLVEELGLEPSSRVRSLYQAVLVGSPELDGPDALREAEGARLLC